MFVFTIGDIIGLAIIGLSVSALLLSWGALWGASKIKSWRGKRK